MLKENLKRIGKKASCFRPYFLNYNDKSYEVEKIIFFKNNETILKTKKWLEKFNSLETAKKYCSGIDIEEIFIKEPIKKIKENLSLKENYFISKTNQFNEKVCSLYIYVDDVDIKITKTKEETITETFLDINDYFVTYTEYEIKGITEEKFKTVTRKSDEGKLNKVGLKANALVEKHKNDYELNFNVYQWAKILKKYELKEIES